MSVITRAYAEKAAQRNGSVQVFPSRFVHGRFTQFIAISLRRPRLRTAPVTVMFAKCVVRRRRASGLVG